MEDDQQNSFSPLIWLVVIKFTSCTSDDMHHHILNTFVIRGNRGVGVCDDWQGGKWEKLAFCPDTIGSRVCWRWGIILGEESCSQLPQESNGAPSLPHSRTCIEVAPCPIWLSILRCHHSSLVVIENMVEICWALWWIGDWEHDIGVGRNGGGKDH